MAKRIYEKDPVVQLLEEIADALEGIQQNQENMLEYLQARLGPAPDEDESRHDP